MVEQHFSLAEQRLKVLAKILRRELDCVRACECGVTNAVTTFCHPTASCVMLRADQQPAMCCHVSEIVR
jgi:hypothetical protein